MKKNSLRYIIIVIILAGIVLAGLILSRNPGQTEKNMKRDNISSTGDYHNSSDVDPGKQFRSNKGSQRNACLWKLAHFYNK